MKFYKWKSVSAFIAIITIAVLAGLSSSTAGCSGSKFQSCFIDCSNKDPQDVGTVVEYVPSEKIVTHCWTLDLTKLPEHILALLSGMDPEVILKRILYVEELTGQGCLENGTGEYKFYTLESDKDNLGSFEVTLPGSAVQKR